MLNFYILYVCSLKRILLFLLVWMNKCSDRSIESETSHTCRQLRQPTDRNRQTERTDGEKCHQLYNHYWSIYANMKIFLVYTYTYYKNPVRFALLRVSIIEILVLDTTQSWMRYTLIGGQDSSPIFSISIRLTPGGGARNQKNWTRKNTSSKTHKTLWLIDQILSRIQCL